MTMTKIYQFTYQWIKKSPGIFSDIFKYGINQIVIDKNNKMKILIYLLTLTIIFTSCKTTEHYVHDGVEILVIEDTITIPSHHSHYEDYNCDKFCIYIEESNWSCTDTIVIEKFKYKKVRIRKVL
jgi:hypothetical protein